MTLPRSFAPYALITAGLGLIFLALSKTPAIRVGDGMEYYALYYAWLDTFRPWMSPTSFQAYQELFGRQEISGLQSAQNLAAAFPALRLGETADFNHFWLYSFLAFFLSAPLQAIGFQISAHQSFLLLHCVLLIGLFTALYRLFHWQGVAAAIVMTMLSPMLWYLNKVHAEVFTFAFTLLAVAFVYRRIFLAGALCLAIAATQNPSFALIAFIPFFYRIAILRDKPFSAIEVIIAIATALLVLIHPVYYFFRYGVPTPQLLAGGASLGGNLSTFYIWLIDPDLGLLPYWPIGAVTILLALAISIMNGEERQREEVTVGRFFLLFITAYFLVNFYAHSSTINLNSGATVGPARYALWYLPTFLPVLLFVLNNLKGRTVLLSVWILSIGFSAWMNSRISNPSKDEDYQKPSYVSQIVQTYFSWLYSPPDEVFAERYSGYGEAIHSIRPRAILGPDCKKVLVYSGDDRSEVTMPTDCFSDSSELRSIADEISREWPTSEPHYAWLSKEQQYKIGRKLNPGKYVVGLGGDGNFIMISGWSVMEEFGVWSEGPMAKLALPCNAHLSYSGRDNLILRLHIQPYGSQYLTMKHENQIVFQGSLSSESNIDIPLNPKDCKGATMDIDIFVANPMSPDEITQSGVPRKLGVALLDFDLI